MPKATSKDLLFVSKAQKERLDALIAGASLVARTGYGLDKLRIKATMDRIDLARSMLKSAQHAAESSPPANRVAVSRAYYSLYHAFRAVTYFTFGGDDHESHTVLPSKLPADFPSRAGWENRLKLARFERNRADYDPYPRNDATFRGAAVLSMADAASLFPIAKDYLRRKGCTK